MKKKLLALVLAAGMVASMAACGNTNSNGSASADNSKDTSAAAESTDSDLAYVKDKGTLVVGITDFEPMDYQDENGNWIGFDADLASPMCWRPVCSTCASRRSATRSWQCTMPVRRSSAAWATPKSPCRSAS